MIARNISIAQLNQALAACNAEHDYRLIWNRQPEVKGRTVHFTIRSEKSGIRGASMSRLTRNSPAASWHAHGHLFNAIFAIAPQASVVTAHATYRPGDAWVDFNVGSQFCPVMASECSVF